eukprot:scpid87029/ scgid9707/ 
MCAMSKTVLCDMVVKAWQAIPADLIKKSFLCCGQTPDAKVDDISCFKDGRPAAEGRARLEELFALPLEQFQPGQNGQQHDVFDELDQEAVVLGDDEVPVSDSSEESDTSSSGFESE